MHRGDRGVLRAVRASCVLSVLFFFLVASLAEARAAASFARIARAVRAKGGSSAQCNHPRAHTPCPCPVLSPYCATREQVALSSSIRYSTPSTSSKLSESSPFKDTASQGGDLLQSFGIFGMQDDLVTAATFLETGTLHVHLAQSAARTGRRVRCPSTTEA